MKPFGMKLLYYGLPTLVLIASVLTFNAGDVLKRPWGKADDVRRELSRSSALALDGRWDEANNAWLHLHTAWESVRKRIILTSDIDEMLTFDQLVAELQGAIEAKDDTQVRIAARKMEAIWAELGR